MKCKKCRSGDYHLLDEIWRFRWIYFWRKPKIVGYIFVCDNCGNTKKIENK